MKANFFRQHNLVKPNDLCFDIGVRDGKVTRELLALGAEVVCVDANPEHAARMRQLFGYKVYVVTAAVMDKQGEGILYSKGNDRFTMTPEVYGKQFGDDMSAFRTQQTVKTTTIDALAETWGTPDFIKLDVEGGERKALRGMSFRSRAVVYEWGGGYIEEAYLCADLLGDEYEFNWIEGHHGELMAGWTSAWELNIDVPLRNEAGKHRWGNVICRKVEK